MPVPLADPLIRHSGRPRPGVPRPREIDEPSDLASAPQPSEGHKLIPITIDSGVDIDSIRVRGDTVVVRTTRRPHCGGTPPAGPTSVRIEVPNNAEHVVLKSRRRGRCKNRRGPPPV